MMHITTISLKSRFVPVIEGNGQMQTQIIKITGYGSAGEGVGRLDDGRVAFVRGAVDGETLEVSLTKERKRSVWAEIVRIIEPSPNRIEPDCPFFPKCGGCDFQHITYEEELRAKLTRVNDAMERIGGLKIRAPGILSTLQKSGYRNKAVFHTDGKEVGFYSAGTNEIIPIDRCLLLKDDINIELKKIVDGESELLKYKAQNHAINSGQDEKGKTKSNAGKITLRSGIHGLHNRSTPLEEKLGDLSFYISGFFQINTDATLLLYNKAREYAALTKRETMVDLYCGVGTMTAFIGRDAGQAIGVELNKDAVKTARKNAYRNGFEHIKFICADAGSWGFSEVKNNRTKSHAGPKRVDCVVVDPPRKGLSKKVIEKILSLSPSRIVYVSCDSATLARDVKLLLGYEVKELCAIDMFPRTANVECCCLLHRVG